MYTITQQEYNQYFQEFIANKLFNDESGMISYFIDYAKGRSFGSGNWQRCLLEDLEDEGGTINMCICCGLRDAILQFRDWLTDEEILQRRTAARKQKIEKFYGSSPE